MKKAIIPIILIVSLLLSSITIYADDSTSNMKKLIDNWFQSAITSAESDDYNSFLALYKDVDEETVQSEFSFFKDKIVKLKYKYWFTIVSEREDGTAIIDSMVYTNTSKGKTTSSDWYTKNLYFERTEDSAIRIESTTFLIVDYVKANNQEYIDGFINNDCWVKYKKRLLVGIVPAIQYAKLNEDRSITLIITISNAYKSDIKYFRMETDNKDKSSVTFGTRKFNLTKCLVGKTIKAKSMKSYKVTISSDRVSKKLVKDDIYKCTFALYYSFIIDDVEYEGHTFCGYTGRVMI